MPAFDEVYLERFPGETRIALIRAGQLQELHLHRESRPVVGDVFLGRMVGQAMNGAAGFVEIGAARSGFLPIEDTPTRTLPPVGAAVMVQVVQEPRGEKGAKLTAKVSLAGEVLAYTPLAPGAALSSRLANKAERTRLRAWAEASLAPDEGAVVRTQAFGVSEAVLSAELDRLRGQWDEMQSRAKGASPPQRLTVARGALAVALDGREAERIYCFGPDAVIEAKRARPDLSERIIAWKGQGRMFAAEGLDDAFDEAVMSRVPLGKGAMLSLEETAALVAVDVDSGPLSPEDANAAAVPEIARQIALRALAGLIVIDFAATRRHNAEAKKALARALERAFADDPTPTEVMGVTASGLVEVRRDRRRPPLSDLLLAPAMGRGLSAESEALAALRGVLAQDMAAPGSVRTLDVSPAAAAVLRGALAFAWRETERRLGRALEIVETKENAR